MTPMIRIKIVIIRGLEFSKTKYLEFIKRVGQFFRGGHMHSILMQLTISMFNQLEVF